MWDFLIRPSLAFPAVVLLLYVAYLTVKSYTQKLPDLPIVGLRPGEWFGLFRAGWRNLLGAEDAIRHAYAQYTKHGLPCIMPVAGAGHLILMPPSAVRWTVEQPDDILDNLTPFYDIIQFDRTFPIPVLARKTTHHHHVVTRDLTSQVGYLVSDLLDEAEKDLDVRWGSNDQNWTEFTLYETLIKLVSKTTNRLLVGPVLCRDQSFLDACEAFSLDVAMASNVLRLLPRVLRPILSPLITLPNRWHNAAFNKYIIPEIKSRLQALKGTADSKVELGQPRDFLQWLINHAAKTLPPAESDPYVLAGRLLIMEFSALHTTGFALTHVLYDLLSSDPDHITQLREEIATVLARHDGRFTKHSLQQMVKLDSTIRESQRLHPPALLGVQRQVMKPDGIVTPTDVHLGPGSIIAFPQFSIHRDPDIYPPSPGTTGEAEENHFIPFRFAAQRDQKTTTSTVDELGGGSHLHHQQHLHSSRLSLPTTSPHYLTFGHGRHACLGRFFAATELKLLLAHILAEFDLHLLTPKQTPATGGAGADQWPSRPKDLHVGVVTIPDLKAKVRVRRRK